VSLHISQHVPVLRRFHHNINEAICLKEFQAFAAGKRQIWKTKTFTLNFASSDVFQNHKKKSRNGQDDMKYHVTT